MAKHATEIQYQDVRKQIGNYRHLDYHPDLRPAGRTVLGPGLGDCFREYNVQDGVDALKNILQIRGNPDYVDAAPIQSDQRHVGMYTEVKACLEPNRKTPFELLVAELKDTAMKSYWKLEVGKTPDQTPNLPAGMDTLQTTFGKVEPSGGTVAELVNPPKTDAEVILNSHTGHRLYRKSHNDYYPAEQVNREYKEPFNKHYCYGRPSNVDRTGGRVNRSIKWFNQDVASVVSCLQADYLVENHSRIGQQVVNSRIAPLLVGRTFGKRSDYGIFGVSELLKDSPPTSDKAFQRDYLEHINSLRLTLKKRNPTFPFMDLYQTFVFYDRKQEKSMTMEQIYFVLATFDIQPDRTQFEILLKTLNLIVEGKVSYKDVTDLLNWRCEFPELPKISDVPLKYQNYCSTYMDSICNAHFAEGIKRHTAGLPTERIDVPYAVVPPGRPRCERESLGDQTSVAAIISPNIFTQNGLSHIDFFAVRNKQDIRTVFENIGVEFPGNSFDVIWEQGLKKDCTGGVCVETFRGLLDQLAAATYEDIPIT